MLLPLISIFSGAFVAELFDPPRLRRSFILTYISWLLPLAFGFLRLLLPDLYAVPVEGTSRR
jgi:hypothetical protein